MQNLDEILEMIDSLPEMPQPVEVVFDGEWVDAELKQLYDRMVTG